MTIVSAVTWRGSVQRVILILSATLVAFLGAGGVSGAAEIHGRVVRIADGDTLTLVTGGSRTPARASASRTAFGRGIPVASANVGVLQLALYME